MSKFNTSVAQVNRTENLAGGEAFIQSPKMELASVLLTSFVQDQFYRGESETINRLAELIGQIPDKQFVAKAAIYTRTKYGMRSVSHVVAGELAKAVQGQVWAKDFFDKIIYRPDDMLEIAAYFLNAGGKRNVTHAMRKGFSQALSRFDEYQLAKYRGARKAKSLVDVVNTVHPANSDAIAKLVAGTLRSTDTWETKLTQAGQKAETDEQKQELKAEAWAELIKEKKIGYFALLRNLRNILEQAPTVLDKALALLVDENLIVKSLVLPFRFTTALKEIAQLSAEGTRETLIALNKAVDIAVANVPKLDGKTLVVLDTSGSMGGRPAEIGSLFAAVLVKSNNADFITFSNSAHYQALNPMDSTITIARSIDFLAGGTNFHAIFQTANKPYDRIVLLSDMQGWVGDNAPTQSFAEYKQRIGANPKVYSFDLAGHGTLQFPEPNVYCLAGFSEKVFDVMKLLETDRHALISEIEKVEL